MQLQAALTRWCSSQQTTEDEAVILASDYIPADIKEAVCSDDLQVSFPGLSGPASLLSSCHSPPGTAASPHHHRARQRCIRLSLLPVQVRRNMMSMLHALLFPGAELQASKPPQPAPPATQPGNGPGNAAHQQLGSAAVGTHKQPMPPPRRKPATGNGVFQPALPKQSSAAHRPPTSYLPGRPPAHTSHLHVDSPRLKCIPGMQKRWGLCLSHWQSCKPVWTPSTAAVAWVSAEHQRPTMNAELALRAGVGLPQAALPDPYSMQGRSAAQLMPPVQYGPAAGRQPPLGPVLQPGLRANQASEAQQAMLMQVTASAPLAPQQQWMHGPLGID